MTARAFAYPQRYVTRRRRQPRALAPGCYHGAMRYLLLMAAMLLLAAPLSAVRLKLKADSADFEATVLRLSDGEVVYQRGRREFRAALTDFEAPSAFLIRQQFTPDEGAAYLELARFALHRALYEQAGSTAREAARLDADLAERANELADTARVLHADALLQQGADALDAHDVENGRALLTRVTEEFADTPSLLKARILLGTIPRVELEIKARQLEDAARQAQEEADEEERMRRKPVDDWLTGLNEQVESARESKLEADRENVANRIHIGLPIYDNAIRELKKIREALVEHSHRYIYRGQIEHSNNVDRAAKELMVDCYERWVFHLYRHARYDTAAQVCNTALKLAPSDRRLLSLKVDIDDVYDPTRR